MNEILSVCFFAHQQHILDALSPISDTFLVPNPRPKSKSLTGLPEDLDALEIEYEKYHSCLIFYDGTSPGPKHLLVKCIENGIQVFGCQHGYNKTAFDIGPITPNSFSRYWLCYGEYMIDLYQKAFGKNPAEKGWVPIGSVKHDFLHRSHRWAPNKTNGKALILHEPDTDECENDPFPLKSSYLTQKAIESMLKAGIEFDFKIHPGWPDFIGNTGINMWQPPKETNIVDIGMKEMLNYECLIGSWSSCLLDAVSMNMPVINLDYKDYPSQGFCEWVPGKIGLLKSCEAEKIDTMIGQKGLNDYDYNKIEYLLGPLGKVEENLAAFVKKSLS